MLAGVLLSSLQAEPPKLNIISPLAIEKGVTQKILIRGLNLPANTQIHFGENEHKILRCFHSRKSTPPPNRLNKLVTGDTQFTLELTVPPSFEGSSLPLFLETPEGKTKTASIQILPHLQWEKNNDGSFEKAIPIKPGTPVHGTIHKNQDVDTYKISAQAGQTLVAQIQANTIASALDSFLYLCDDQFHILASNDDHGQKRDSKITFQIPKNGDYFLSVLDAHDYGDPVLHPYLLTTELQNPPAPKVSFDFPGGNVNVLNNDPVNKVLRFRPIKHKNRGWDCWWYFKVEGLSKGQTWQFQLEGSGFTTPRQAAFSTDNQIWQQTAPGKKEKNLITYALKVPANTLWLAWGPPFHLDHANQLVDEVAAAKVGAKKFTLCTSKDGHKVPALRWTPEGGKDLPAIWIQARQHAWESGSSWVCRGFTQWLASSDMDATWLRQNARICIVPIMDIDNVQRGAGGKNQIPHDHNRDWGEEPIHPEVKAAQKLIKQLNQTHTFSLFIDLHNPGPGDRKPFFFAAPKDHMTPQRIENQTKFINLCKIHLPKEPLGFNPNLRITGANYHPLWRRISKNWVAQNTRPDSVCLTLETSWDTPNSTQTGYLNYGRALGRSILEFLQK